AECARLRAESLTLRAEREKYERARRVLPLLTKRHALAAERDVLGAALRLSPDAARERREAETARRDAQLRLEHTHAEIARLREEHGALTELARPELAQLAPSAVESLRDRLVAH